MKRYTVKEAAQVLGVGTDAIRKRAQRDTITHERIDGVVYIWLDEDEPRHDNGVTEGLIEAYKDQLESYKDQVEHLRRELDVRNEELRRKDTIIMQMAQANAALAAKVACTRGPCRAARRPYDGHRGAE